MVTFSVSHMPPLHCLSAGIDLGESLVDQLASYTRSGLSGGVGKKRAKYSIMPDSCTK